MKSIKKKIMAMTAAAVMAIGATGITTASANKEWTSDYDCHCYNEWDKGNDVHSNFYNDEHDHRSACRVGKNGTMVYSGTGSSDYNASAGEWSYASAHCPWYHRAYTWYDNDSDC